MQLMSCINYVIMASVDVAVTQGSPVNLPLLIYDAIIGDKMRKHKILLSAAVVSSLCTSVVLLSFAARRLRRCYATCRLCTAAVSSMHAWCF
jgi:hypothetical protein